MAYRTENLLSVRVRSCLSNCMTSWSRVIIVSFGKVLLALPCALLPTTACTLASCWSKILSESLLISRFTWKSPLNVSKVISGCCVVAIAWYCLSDYLNLKMLFFKSLQLADSIYVSQLCLCPSPTHHSSDKLSWCLSSTQWPNRPHTREGTDLLPVIPAYK